MRIRLFGNVLLALMMSGCATFSATDNINTKTLPPRIQFWGISPESIEENDDAIKVRNGVHYDLIAELLHQEAPLSKVRAYMHWEGGSWGKGGVSLIEEDLSRVNIETYRVYPEGSPQLAQTYRLFNLFGFTINGEKKEHGERKMKFEIIVIDKEGRESNKFITKTFLIE